MAFKDVLKNLFVEPSGDLISDILGDRSISQASANKEIVRVARVGLVGDGTNTREWLAPEPDLANVEMAYNADSYVRQAMDTYTKYMFKAGWDFIGSNSKASEYVKQRFELMAEATQKPTQILFMEMAQDFVTFANSITAKARDADYSFPAGIKAKSLNPRGPIVGYFPLKVTEMTVRRDRRGTITSWQQIPEGSDRGVRFRPEDIIHMYYLKDKTAAFATPFLIPAISDVRALRQIEENVLKLVYRNLFPFLHYKVGSEELPGDEAEVDDVRSKVENMDAEGGLVTTERHEIVPVATNQIIDAANYLKYFQRRVITALGVSELLFGHADTANRSTGDNLTDNFIDSVKSFQVAMEEFVNLHMVREILMEGGYDVLRRPEDMVRFRFREIDLASLIKKRNQAIYEYEHNAIDQNEMRAEIGRDPISDGSNMYMYKVAIPLALAKAETPSQNETDNRAKPTNQPKKSQPQKTTRPRPGQQTDIDSVLAYLSCASTSLVKDPTNQHSELADNWQQDLKEILDKAQAMLLDALPDGLGNLQSEISQTFENLLESCRDTSSVSDIQDLIWLFGFGLKSFLNDQSQDLIPSN